MRPVDVDVAATGRRKSPDALAAEWFAWAWIVTTGIAIVGWTLAVLTWTGQL